MKNNPWKKTIIAAICSVFLFIFNQVASGNEALIEQIYSRGIYRLWSQFFSCLAGLVPVSLSEIFLLVGVPVLLIVSVFRLVHQKNNWQQFLSGLLTILLTLYSVFVGGWALNYSRQSYAKTAGLNTQPVEIQKLESLVSALAQQANDLRDELDKNESAYSLDYTQGEVMRLVQDAYDKIGTKCPWLSGRYAAPKIAILSEPLAYLNISGIFSPFTFEAHVNSNEGDLLLGATAAHEAAHLRGFAREDEANFIAYQVCSESENVYLRYSGTMLALIHAGNALAKLDSESYSSLYATYSDAVRADLAAYRENWKPYEGTASEVHEKVNDAYLKANKQSDGVHSYGRMVDLLIALFDTQEQAQCQ